MHVEAKMTRLDAAADSRFFPGFTLRSLAVRKRRLGIAFGERPLVAAIRVHQKELDGLPSPPVADGGHLQWQGMSWISGRPHIRSLRRTGSTRKSIEKIFQQC